MGLFGGDDTDDNQNPRDYASDPYDREPDFRARSLFDLGQSRGIMNAVYKSGLETRFDEPRIEEPKDRSYDAVQTRGDTEKITDATVVWPLTENRRGVHPSDLEEDQFPPQNYVWTHVYGREQPTGEDATEMYTFDFNSKELYARRVSDVLSDAEDSVKAQLRDTVASGGGPEASSMDSSEDIADDELPVGEAYEPGGFQWSDLGVTDGKLEQLKRNIQHPLEQPALYDLAGVDPDGVLLYGPPGTGKTLTTKIAASQASANVIQVSGADLYGELMGQSEENMRDLYEAAREHAPSVVLMDEIDQVASDRGGSVNESSDRIVAQMLQELDGLKPTDQVLTVGTTNRPDMVDDAIKRGGRLGNQIEMSKPPRSARKEIFDIKTRTGEEGRGTLVEQNIDYDELARMAKGYTGADIEEALETAAKKNISDLNSRRDDVAELDKNELMDEVRVSEDDVTELLEQQSNNDRRDEPGFQ